MSNVIYKNIYNNYISSLYLHILSIVKSKEVTIDIFKKIFQWLCDNSSYLDYDKLFITLRRYTSKLITVLIMNLYLMKTIILMSVT